MKSVSITTKAVSSKPAYGEMYSIQGRWFSPDTPVSSTNKMTATQYISNIVESGVKHHKPNPTSCL
jgi:hypothetical protein